MTRIAGLDMLAQYCECEGCESCAKSVHPSTLRPCFHLCLPPRTICRPCSATQHVQGRKAGKS